MSNKNFGKRKKSQSFRPSGGMRNKLLKKEVEKGREDMENGRLLDEPVFDHTHEAEILKAENKAFGVKEEKPEDTPPPQPKEENPKEETSTKKESGKPSSFEDEFEESLAEELGELGPEAIGGNQQRTRNRKGKGRGGRR